MSQRSYNILFKYDYILNTQLYIIHNEFLGVYIYIIIYIIAIFVTILYLNMTTCMFIKFIVLR